MAILPEVEKMIDDGLVMIHDVQMIRNVPGTSNPGYFCSFIFVFPAAIAMLRKILINCSKFTGTYEGCDCRSTNFMNNRG